MTFRYVQFYLYKTIYKQIFCLNLLGGKISRCYSFWVSPALNVQFSKSSFSCYGRLGILTCNCHTGIKNPFLPVLSEKEGSNIFVRIYFLKSAQLNSW